MNRSRERERDRLEAIYKGGGKGLLKGKRICWMDGTIGAYTANPGVCVCFLVSHVQCHCVHMYLTCVLYAWGEVRGKVGKKKGCLLKREKIQR